MHAGRHDPVLAGHKAGQLAVIDARGAQFGGMEDLIDAKAGIVFLAIVKNDGAAQVLPRQRRFVHQGPFGGNCLVRRDVAAKRQPIVQAHPEPEFYGRDEPALVDGEQKWERPHEVRSDPLENVPFPARLEDETKIMLLEVAEPAMDQLGGTARGSTGKVRLLDERHAQTPKGRVARHAGSKNAAANDQQVKILA